MASAVRRTTLYVLRAGTGTSCCRLRLVLAKSGTHEIYRYRSAPARNAGQVYDQSVFFSLPRIVVIEQGAKPPSFSPYNCVRLWVVARLTLLQDPLQLEQNGFRTDFG
jgi:hypothetical protein